MKAEEPAPVVAADLPDNHMLLAAHDGANDEVLCPDCHTWLRVTYAGRLPRRPGYTWTPGPCPRSGAAFVRPANLPAPLRVRLTRGTDRWVVRTETGRRLGWLSKQDGWWRARVDPEAFRGDRPDDHGEVLDQVPARLTREYQPARHEPVGGGSTRAEATRALVRWCRQHRSPAFDFGRHPDVVVWAERRRRR